MDGNECVCDSDDPLNVKDVVVLCRTQLAFNCKYFVVIASSHKNPNFQNWTLFPQYIDWPAGG